MKLTIKEHAVLKSLLMAAERDAESTRSDNNHGNLVEDVNAILFGEKMTSSDVRRALSGIGAQLDHDALNGNWKRSVPANEASALAH